MQDFRNLKVWERAQQFAVEVYRITAGFPKCEQYGLTSQLQRAAVSIVANIAEGCGRGSDADFARFLQMAIGSAFEVDALLLVARDLKYLDEVRRAVGSDQQLIAKSQ
jgi:four helix bundle protein